MKLKTILLTLILLLPIVSHASNWSHYTYSADGIDMSFDFVAPCGGSSGSRRTECLLTDKTWLNVKSRNISGGDKVEVLFKSFKKDGKSFFGYTERRFPMSFTGGHFTVNLDLKQNYAGLYMYDNVYGDEEVTTQRIELYVNGDLRLATEFSAYHYLDNRY